MYTTKKYNHLAISYIQEGHLLQIAVVIALFLGLLYVFEANSVLSFERDIMHKQSSLLQKQQDLSKLEIAAAQLQSAQRIQMDATTENMVSLSAASYVSLNNSPVAFNQ